MKNNVLEQGYEDYSKVIEKYALERFEKVVKPYLQEHHYWFVVGYGWGWSIFDKDEQHHRIPEEKIPKKVLFELEFNIPGLYNVTLANWMPNFKSE